MSVMLLEMAVYQESDVFAMNPIANVDSTTVSNLEGKEYIRFVWNEISSNQIKSKYTLSESILRTIYSHHCVGRNLRKAALLALAEGLSYGKVIVSWGEGHNKSQKTGMIGAPIMIDGVKYLLCVTTMRNRNHVIKPYAITLKDANGNNVEEKTVVGNNLVHDSNNGDSTSGNNRLSTITASHHTNTPLSSNAKVQQNIQTNKQNNENKQYFNMNKNRIRLTESQLQQLIKESVKKMLKEIAYRELPITNDAGEIIDTGGWYDPSDYEDVFDERPYSTQSEINSFETQIANGDFDDDIFNDKWVEYTIEDFEDDFGSEESLYDAIEKRRCVIDKNYAMKYGEDPDSTPKWKISNEKNFPLDYNHNLQDKPYNRYSVIGKNRYSNSDIDNGWIEMALERFRQSHPSDTNKIWKKNGKLRKPTAIERNFKTDTNNYANADRKPLHRKGSLNRELDESIRRAIQKVLR